MITFVIIIDFSNVTIINNILITTTIDISLNIKSFLIYLLFNVMNFHSLSLLPLFHNISIFTHIDTINNVTIVIK